ncbi:sensor histidine kinase [Paenibacillus sp. MBLB4367]|uniref:sensor histidine kinase n=1 Tax=Paenibacillus sp. MBLB4367 TaxID=3384767 RepID=UPI0039083F19
MNAVIDRRKWNWADWVFFTIFSTGFFISLLAIVFQQDPMFYEHRSAAIIGTLLGYFIPLVFWRPGYVHYYFFPIAILVTNGTFQVWATVTLHESIPILTLPAIIMGYLAHRSTIWWFAPLIVLGPPILDVFFVTQDHPAYAFIGSMFNYAIILAVGMAVNRIMNDHLRRKRLYDENLKQYHLIREQNRALEQYSTQVEKLTLLEERNRLARELHDTVGHTFTSVIMGMDAVSYLMDSAPDKAKEKLEVLRNLTRKGLEEVRRSIHQIAPVDDSHTLSQQLSQLAAEFSTHTGTQVKIKVSGDEIDLPKQMHLTLIRCLQESLTNAKRHGEAVRVDVWIDFSPESVLLRIEDNGSGTEKLKEGFGLTAMRERISSLNGTLQASSARGFGTTITCKIPIRQPSKSL